MHVLDIDVPEPLAARWIDWFAPARQPYVMPAAVAAPLGFSDDRAALSPELRDTFALYGLTDDDAVVWFDRKTFAALAPETRASLTARQPERHRWRDERTPEQLVRWIEQGCRPSRHDALPDAVRFRAAAAGLPRARELAGTFPDRSGPNCFGTVMATAGVMGAELEWMQREPFEEWLAWRAIPLPRGPGHDGDPGVVLVWRGRSGDVEHAAITLGDGWALHKRSQCWQSPVEVLSVDGVKAGSRAPGRLLHRYRLVAED